MKEIRTSSGHFSITPKTFALNRLRKMKFGEALYRSDWLYPPDRLTLSKTSQINPPAKNIGQFTGKAILKWLDHPAGKVAFVTAMSLPWAFISAETSVLSGIGALGFLWLRDKGIIPGAMTLGTPVLSPEEAAIATPEIPKQGEKTISKNENPFILEAETTAQEPLKLKEPIALVILGHDKIRLVISKPETEGGIETTIPIRLGPDLDLNDERLSEAAKALATIKTELEAEGILPENLHVVSTTGLQEVVTKRLSRVLNAPVEVLDPLAEAAAVYTGALQNIEMPADQKNMVIQLHRNGTDFIFGHGHNRIHNGMTQESYLPFGWGRLSVENMDNPFQVKLNTSKVQTLLEEWISDEALNAVKGRSIYLGADSDLQALIALEKNRTGHDITTSGLDAKTIAWYLSTEGTNYLQQQLNVS